jgi:hypothetical protein
MAFLDELQGVSVRVADDETACGSARPFGARRYRFRDSIRKALARQLHSEILKLEAVQCSPVL